MISKHRFLVQVTLEQLPGRTFEANIPGTEGNAHAAFALSYQGDTFMDKNGRVWKVGPIMLLKAEQMIGRRAVCEEEGHVIPEKPKDSTFGCKRCDYIFIGSAGQV